MSLQDRPPFARKAHPIAHVLLDRVLGGDLEGVPEQLIGFCRRGMGGWQTNLLGELRVTWLWGYFFKRVALIKLLGVVPLGVTGLLILHMPPRYCHPLGAEGAKGLLHMRLHLVLPGPILREGKGQVHQTAYARLWLTI